MANVLPIKPECEHQVPQPTRLNLGAGATPLPGYDNSFDLDQGKSAFPLELPDASVDEIRASHLLEHFSHRATSSVLADWVRVLKPGGLLRIAVPDFESICRAYAQDAPIPYQEYLSGGHVDIKDVHLAQFDYQILSLAMRRAGLAGIHTWRGAGDCSEYDISLNLAGWKRPASPPKVSAVMSVPRLAFMDNYFAAFEALSPLRIALRKSTGAFWGQCMTRVIEQAIAEGAEWVLTIDYDTLFSRATVEDLIAFALHADELGVQADAIVPLQMHRNRGAPMLHPWDHPAGSVRLDLDAYRDQALVRLRAAHFGCTLLRVSAFERLALPWFHSTPGADGRWDMDGGKLDDDIFFWRNWESAGNTLHLAPRVAIGHLELMSIWPDRNLEPVYLHPSDYFRDGLPSRVWQ